MYKTILDAAQTEIAIYKFKNFFQKELAKKLKAQRITAPMFVKAGTGINDDLNGIEKPVSFKIKNMNDTPVEIVQSLAKWKRIQLKKLKIPVLQGIYTDMNAIRPDDEVDQLHSIYVDQWDWEIVIRPQDRTISFLKKTVRKIYHALQKSEKFIYQKYPDITPILPAHITFITSEELEKKYPGLSPKQREDQICQQHKAVFIIGIGYPLQNGQPHDGRAPDYDDWSTATKLGHGLNGDLLVWSPLLKQAVELSSMGIRVDKKALATQLALRHNEERQKLFFHQLLLSNQLPLSIGGGIGQSRLCMFFLRKIHIGEVQASIWPESMLKKCQKENIFLL